LEALFALALCAAAVAGAVVWQARFAEPRASPWQGLAEACGLEGIRPVSRFASELTGRFGALEVLFGSYSPSKYKRSTLVTMRGLSQFVALKHESLGTRIDRVLGGGEIEIGDDTFDRALYLQGDERLFRALLDAETRQLLMEAFSGGVGAEGVRDQVRLQLGNGQMQAAFTDSLGSGPLPRPATVRWFLDLARRLQHPADVSARLAANAERDPLPSVRRLILRTLERTAPTEPVTREAMERAARGDPDGSVRLQAALWLGKDGRSTLEALSTDGVVEDSVSARAIQALGEDLALDQARRILDESLAAGRVLTLSAAAAVVGRGGEAQVPCLAALLERASGAVGVAAAGALGGTGSAQAEEPLLAALGRADEELQAAAAGALGQVGSSASVLPLKALAESRRGRPRAAALGALARIRERLTGVEPGRLALAAPSGGEVTLTDGEEGRMSLPDPPEPS
jgi:HEAT repeats